MKALPDTEHSLVLRTDFSSDATWESLCREIQEPVGEFCAILNCVSDPAFDGLSVERIVELSLERAYRSFLFVVDQTSIADTEHPVLVVDLLTDPGRTFRVIPREMWSVENNLSLANMDFEDFADSTDPDGVFRGFPEA